MGGLIGGFVSGIFGGGGSKTSVKSTQESTVNVSVDPQIGIGIENIIDLEPIQKLVDDLASQAREGVAIQSLVAREGIVAVREQAQTTREVAQTTRELGTEFGDLAAEFLRANRQTLIVVAGVGALLVLRKGK